MSENGGEESETTIRPEGFTIYMHEWRESGTLALALTECAKQSGHHLFLRASDRSSFQELSGDSKFGNRGPLHIN